MSDALAFHMNHVALSMLPSDISGVRREEILHFYGTVFNWTEYVEDERFVDEFTQELKALLKKDVEPHPPLVMLTGSGHFVFLYGLDEPMRSTPVDHFGFEVKTEEELDGILQKAKKYAEGDDEVSIVDKAVTSYEIDESLLDQYPGKQVDLINCYIGYRLPMAVEVQLYRWKA